MRPVFADLKNDFVFRRIFATHPDLLRALLNDLLERTGEQEIDGIEYLPSEQLPIFDGAKLSILDVRCRDRQGTTFIVEVQLLHHPGFLNRVVYNACKAYVSPLKAGEGYSKLTDVVAIAICDFDLWPDVDQEKSGLPLVPMLSRWNMVERQSKNHGLLQVQYAFLELSKVPQKRPEKPGPDLWAWLFVHAPELDKLPDDLVAGPHRAALELANRALFTPDELDVYQRVNDEIRQVLEIAASKYALGKAAGKAEGRIQEKRANILRILDRSGIALDKAERARIDACVDLATLDRWFDNALGAKTANDVFGQKTK